MPHLPPHPPIVHPTPLCGPVPASLLQSGVAEALGLLGVVLLVMLVVLLIKRPLERLVPPTHVWHDRILQTLPVVLVALTVTALGRTAADFSNAVSTTLFVVHILAGGGLANGAYKLLRHSPMPLPGR